MPMREAYAALRLCVAQHGDTVAGKKIQVIAKDDAAIADNSKRLVAKSDRAIRLKHGPNRCRHKT
jgi:hypothetical protein